MKRIFIIILSAMITFAFPFTGCKKVTEQDLAIKQLEREIKENPGELVKVKELIEKYFSAGRINELTGLYEQYSDDFSEDAFIQVYYGASLCMKAGLADKIEDKLYYVKVGMMKLDECVNNFPDEKIVYLWRAISDSNLPAILNARGIVEDDINHLYAMQEAGKWNLTQDDLLMIYNAYLNLIGQYGDLELYNSVFNRMNREITNKEHTVFTRYNKMLKKLENKK